MNYKGYHHLKWEDRLKIEGALKTGGKPAEIAEMLGVCVKTIYNEIKRGLCLQQKEGYIFQEEYCAEVAERKYQEHLRAKGPEIKLGRDHAFANFVERKIIEDTIPPGRCWPISRRPAWSLKPISAKQPFIPTYTGGTCSWN